jgi:CRISPR-associated protein Cas2
MRVVVAYDISDDKERQKVADLLEMVLPRVQYSVFEGDVPKEVLAKTVQKAITHLDSETDSLRVYHLCAKCADKVDLYGQNRSLEAGPVRVL